MPYDMLFSDWWTPKPKGRHRKANIQRGIAKRKKRKQNGR